ncbi:hypothetical protein BKA64DRAFT_464422 [Cadophora sp. MPI-SDFR-AT-0126]|nr:hypothetical protein BKA64DRAFT_464422 [Leotiomycetes sp. MPI-SDFR-AT-0126]
MVQIASIVSAFGLIAAAVAGPLVERQVTAPIIIGDVTYDGSGCPPGSIEVGNINFQTWEFELFYKKLTTSIKGGDPKTKVKCQIRVPLKTVSNTQLVLLAGSYRGHVAIEKGVYAKQQNQYKFDKNPGTTNMQWEFKGPMNASTTFTNELAIEFQSGCSQGGQFTLIINNYLTMTSEDGGSGSITVSELDAAVKQSVVLKSKAC